MESLSDTVVEEVIRLDLLEESTRIRCREILSAHDSEMQLSYESIPWWFIAEHVFVVNWNWWKMLTQKNFYLIL